MEFNLFELAKRYKDKDLIAMYSIVYDNAVNNPVAQAKARATMLRGDNCGCTPGQPDNPGQSGSTVNLPIAQQPISVDGAAQLLAVVPDWANVYVFASVTFTDGCPVLNEPCTVIYSRENDTFEVIAQDNTYRYSSILPNGKQWSSSLVSVPEIQGCTMTKLMSMCTHYPMHIEVMNALFNTSASEADCPNSTLGPRWMLDVCAFNEDYCICTAQGYGKEYINTYTTDRWLGWISTDSASGYYINTETVTGFTLTAYRNWVTANVEDSANRIYAVEYTDVKCAESLSPTGSSDTQYHLMTNKTSDGHIIFDATIISGGTSEYPNGTRFKNIYDATTLTGTGWTVAESLTGAVVDYERSASISAENAQASAELAQATVSDLSAQFQDAIDKIDEIVGGV